MRLMQSKYRYNANAWNAVYRVSTERALLKSLRDRMSVRGGKNNLMGGLQQNGILCLML